MANKVYSTGQAYKQMGAPSERWLIEKLRSGEFPGRKVGRNWRMTEEDILDALDTCKNEGIAATPSGLTPRSRKRVTST